MEKWNETMKHHRNIVSKVKELIDVQLKSLRDPCVFGACHVRCILSRFFLFMFPSIRFQFITLFSSFIYEWHCV